MTLSSLLFLSACSTGSPTAEDDASPTTSADTAGDAEVIRAEPREVASISPRVVISHDEGLVTLDAESGETVDTVAEPGFFRLNNAGDGQHVMVTAGNEFRVYNAGVQAQAHGDHFHYYESDPGLTGATFDADYAGHVVLHNGRTTLFADGTGAISTFTSSDLAYGEPSVDETATEDPHHGVAIELTDGTLLTTQGTEDARSTVQHVEVAEDGSTEVLAETTDCPGVHGEAAAAANEEVELSDVVVFGCENGPVVFRDGDFHKVDVEPEYQRSGNLAGSEVSPIVLGDWKIDPDAEQERPTEVALINTLEDSVQTVELDSSYWFRSLARGDDGEALVLTYNGQLNVIDEETGEVTERIDAIEAWEEQENWQQPGPILKATDGKAYVTDAANQQLVIVDLDSAEVEQRIDLDVTPVEMSVVTGSAEAPQHESGSASAADEHADEEHDHDDHDHDH
ncbi:MAG: hypothetical protein ACTHZ5_09230 [Micrococcaceae bacterium]